MTQTRTKRKEKDGKGARTVHGGTKDTKEGSEPPRTGIRMYQGSDVEQLKVYVEDIRDAAQKRADMQRSSTWPGKRRVMELVRAFIVKKQRLINGGAALNELAVNVDPRLAIYDETDGEPSDIDFYSPQPILDVIEISHTLHANGFADVRASEALHSETYSVFMGGWKCCDVSYMDAHTYHNLSRLSLSIESVKPVSMRLTHPHFMLIDSLRVMNDPILSYFRLDKAFQRLVLLQNLFPLPLPPSDYSFYLPENAPRTSLYLPPLMTQFVHGNDHIVVVGEIAVSYYKAVRTKSSAQKRRYNGQREKSGQSTSSDLYSSKKGDGFSSLSSQYDQEGEFTSVIDQIDSRESLEAPGSPDSTKNTPAASSSSKQQVGGGTSSKKKRHGKKRKMNKYDDNKKKEDNDAKGKKPSSGRERDKEEKEEQEEKEREKNAGFPPPILEFVTTQYKEDCARVWEILRRHVPSNGDKEADQGGDQEGDEGDDQEGNEEGDNKNEEEKEEKERQRKKLTYFEHRPFFDFTGRRGEFYIDGKCVVRVFDHRSRCIPYVNVIAPHGFSIQLGTFTVTVMFLLIMRFQLGTFRDDMKTQQRYDGLIYDMYAVRNKYLKSHRATIFDETPFREFVVQCKGNVKDLQTHKNEVVQWKKNHGKTKGHFKYDPNIPTDAFNDTQYCNTSGNVIKNPHDVWFKGADPP